MFCSETNCVQPIEALHRLRDRVVTPCSSSGAAGLTPPSRSAPALARGWRKRPGCYLDGHGLPRSVIEAPEPRQSRPRRWPPVLLLRTTPSSARGLLVCVGAAGQLVPIWHPAPPSFRGRSPSWCLEHWLATALSPPPCCWELERLEQRGIPPPAICSCRHMPACSRDWLLQLPVEAGLLQATRPRTRWAPPWPPSWPVPGCSTCAAAATAKPPLNLAKAIGRRSERGQGWASRCCRAAAADRGPSCLLAAVWLSPHRRTAVAALLKRLRELAAARAFLLGLGTPQPGWGGTGARARWGSATPRVQHGGSPCAPAHARGWQAIQAGLASASGCDQEAAVPSHPRPMAPWFALQGSARAPPRDLLMALLGQLDHTVAARPAPGAAAWRRAAGSAGGQSSRAAPPTPCARWAGPLRAACSQQGGLARRRQPTSAPGICCSTSRASPLPAQSSRPCSTPSPAVEGQAACPDEPQARST